MADKNWTQTAGVAWYAQLAARPHAYDFYQVLRRFEALHADLPRVGDAARPADEPVRLAQDPSLSFAPANLAGLEQRGHGPPRLFTRFAGLFGPHGALPLHLTELARERLRSYGDPTLARFADLFHHRMLSAFYKAWRQAQPTASHDRPDSDRFAAYVDALFGGGEAQDMLPAHAKRFFAGHLSRGIRHGGGLEAILSAYFGMPVALDPFYPLWMPLPAAERSSLGARSSRIGRSVVIGKRVRDAQHHFLLNIGPLTLAQYRELLPGAGGMLRLRDWVRLYTDHTYGWRAQLLLRREEVPPLQLGRGLQVGWTTWLGKPPGAAVAGHLLYPERETVPAPAPAESPAGASAARGHPQEEPCLK